MVIKKHVRWSCITQMKQTIPSGNPNMDPIFLAPNSKVHKVFALLPPISFHSAIKRAWLYWGGLIEILFYSILYFLSFFSVKIFATNGGIVSIFKNRDQRHQWIFFRNQLATKQDLRFLVTLGSMKPLSEALLDRTL